MFPEGAAADLICFIHVMNQSLHKVDQGNHQARKTHGKSSHGRVRLLLLQLPPSSPRHDTSSHQSPPATALIFFKPMAKNNPTFALNVYNIVQGWFENIQYIYLDFEVVVFKLRSMRGLSTQAANTA